MHDTNKINTSNSPRRAVKLTWHAIAYICKMRISKYEFVGAINQSFNCDAIKQMSHEQINRTVRYDSERSNEC